MWQEIHTSLIATTREGRAELRKMQDALAAIDSDGGEVIARAMPGTGRVIVSIFGGGAVLRDVVAALDHAGYLN